jgi:RNA polymerase sporulation-specific sigma factor
MNRGDKEAGGSDQPTEAALFRRAQAGCRKSLNRLMVRHEHLVHAVVRRQVLGHLPFPEALQAGRIGLWRAILGYDPQRGSAFSTYAWTVIMHRIWREVKLAGRVHQQGMQHVSLQTASICCSQEDLPPKVWESEVLLLAVWQLVARLPERLRIVVVARYGLTGQGRTFYPRIGALLGVSHERARQLHSEALLWLRQPAHSQQVRSLLGRHTLAEYEAVEAEIQRWLQWRGGRDGR